MILGYLKVRVKFLDGDRESAVEESYIKQSSRALHICALLPSNEFMGYELMRIVSLRGEAVVQSSCSRTARDSGIQQGKQTASHHNSTGHSEAQR